MCHLHGSDRVSVCKTQWARRNYMEHHQISWPTLRVTPGSFFASAARLREGRATLTNPTPPGLALRATRPTPRTRCTTRTNVADAGLPFLAAHPGNQIESTLSIARVVNQVPCSMKTKTPKKFSYRGYKRTVIMTEWHAHTNQIWSAPKIWIKTHKLKFRIGTT